jgi:hypothetical protein
MRRVAAPEGTRGLDEELLPNRHHRSARHARERTEVDDADGEHQVGEPGAQEGDQGDRQKIAGNDSKTSVTRMIRVSSQPR